MLSLTDSHKVRKQLEKEGKADRILPSRMVRRMKPAEQPGEPAARKSRWCLRGDKDPDLLSLDRFSPTLCTTTFGVLLQTCASLRYEASVGDLKNAFCQSLPPNREGGPLCATQPGQDRWFASRSIDPSSGWMLRIARRFDALASAPQRKHSGLGLP